MSPPSDRRRLDSWKEIASYLGRTVRTVQRWERDEGLPVRRHVHHKLSSVYAYTDEIDAWWVQNSRSVGEPAKPQALPAPVEGQAPAPEDADKPPPLSSPVSTVVHRAQAMLVASTLCVSLLALGRFTVWQGGVEPATLVLATAGSSSPALDADALYERGRTFWRQRTPRGFEQAKQAFEAALSANPNHARAHAGLADTYTLLESFGLMTPAAALGRARAEAERAVQLAPHLGEAHASLALALWEIHDLSAAMTEMEQSLELDPDYATAHHWYGLFLQQFLRRDEAIAEARRAVALDPSQPVFWTDLASMLKHARRFDEAEAVLREAGGMHQGFPEIYVQLSDLAQQRGDAAQSVALLRRALALGDNRPRIVAKLGCLEGTTGNPVGATEALHLLRDMEASGQHVPDDALASLLAWTGDLDGAFRHIQRGLEQRQDWVGGLIDASGCFEAVRSDPRWPSLVVQIEAASWIPLGSRLARGGGRDPKPPLARPTVED
jgi:tetratricopeptide (TPR) repeat protein